MARNLCCACFCALSVLFSVTLAPCHSAVLLVGRTYVILRERSPDGALLIALANRSCAVWALGNDMFQSASATLLNCMFMSLGTALLFHWFVILLILETPASPCQCGKCGVITNSSYFSVATVSLINYCVCRNQLNFMNSAKTDMTTGCNCNCTLSER